MGVQGLWSLLEPTCRPVTLESLEGQVIAIDVSIWLHQAMKGNRSDVRAPHLVTLLHRIIKLIFYRIKPVIVFDGLQVPVYKKRTLEKRKLKREVAGMKLNKLQQRILNKVASNHALQLVSGGAQDIDEDLTLNLKSAITQKEEREDRLFQLTGEQAELKNSDESSDESDDFDGNQGSSRDYLHPHEIDFESEQFERLPVHDQRELLIDIQEERKGARSSAQDLPSDSDDFSSELSAQDASFTMDYLQKRRPKAASFNIKRIFHQNTKGKREVLMKDVDDMDQTGTDRNPESSVLLERLSAQTKNQLRTIREMADEEIEQELDDEFDDQLQAALLASNQQQRNRKNADDDDTQILDTFDDANKPSTSKQIFAENSVVGSASSTSSSCQFYLNRALEASKHDQDSAGVKLEDFVTIADELRTQQEDEENDPLFISDPDLKRALEESKREYEAGSSACIVWPEFTQKNVDKEKMMNPENPLDNNELLHPIDDQNGRSKVVQLTNVPSSTMDLIKVVPTKKMAADDDTQPVSQITISKSSNEEKNHEGALPSWKNSEKDSAESSSEKIPSSIPPSNAFSFSANPSPSPMPSITQKYVERTEEIPPLLSSSRSSSHYSSSSSANVHKLIEDSTTDKSTTNVIMTISTPPNNDTTDKSATSVTTTISTLPNNDTTEKSVIKVANICTPPNNDTTDKSVIEVATICTPNNDTTNKSVIEVATTISSLPNDKEEKGLVDKEENDDEDDDDDDDFIDVAEPPLSEILKNDKLNVLTPMKTVFSTAGSFEKRPNNPSNHTLLPSQSISAAAAARTSTGPPLIDDSDSVPLSQLIRERNQIEGSEQSMTQQIYSEAQMLLSHLGIPYLVAKGEAEAQCAWLESAGLVSATISDDSDVWLFGSTTVYRNIFRKDKRPQKFTSSEIRNALGLDRDKLILIAMLTGCDYSEGVENVGVVAAMEIISQFSEFNEKGVGPLVRFMDWWKCSQTETFDPNRDTALLFRLKKLQCHFPPSFPDEGVYKGFKVPLVDESDERFSWSQPDFDGLKRFLQKYVGWDGKKTDETLLPVMDKFAGGAGGSHQRKINQYFTVQLEKDERDMKISPSKRVSKAARQLKSIGRDVTRRPPPISSEETTKPPAEQSKSSENSPVPKQKETDRKRKVTGGTKRRPPKKKQVLSNHKKRSGGKRQSDRSKTAQEACSSTVDLSESSSDDDKIY